MRFSVDARLIAEALKKDVYVIADYYYIPWALRFYNLCSYVQPGDVLILSLEFFQYTEQYHVSKIFRNVLRKKDPSIYTVLGLYCDYINSPGVPFWYKYQQSFFIHPLLTGWFWKMNRNRGEMALELIGKENAPYSVKTGSGQGGRYNVILPAEPSRIRPIDPDRRSMVDDVLIKNQFKIRKGVQADLAVLKRMKEKGVKIFWGWPVAIWTKQNLCEAVEERKHFIKEVKELISNYGIEWLGEFEDFVYPPEAQYEGNTYHINEKYRERHTKKIIDLLKRSLQN